MLVITGYKLVVNTVLKNYSMCIIVMIVIYSSKYNPNIRKVRCQAFKKINTCSWVAAMARSLWFARGNTLLYKKQAVKIVNGL